MAPKAATRLVAEHAVEEAAPPTEKARPSMKKSQRLKSCDEYLEKLHADLHDTAEALSRGDVDFEDLFSD